MKHVNLAWLGALALSLWCTTVGAQAQLGPSPMEPGGMLGDDLSFPLPLILRGVNLTPDQQARVQKMMQANRTTFRTLFSQLEAAQEGMAEKLSAPGAVDVADLTAQARQVTQLREQLMQAGLKVALEVRGVLTPAQLAKASQLKERIRAMHTEMRNLLDERP
jgi:Spy/CpxP family protein refolding chaperone